MPSYKKDGSGVMPRLALYNNMISSTTKNWKWHVHFFATSMKRSPRIRMSGSCHFKYPARDAQPDNKCLSQGHPLHLLCIWENHPEAHFTHCFNAKAGYFQVLWRWKWHAVGSWHWVFNVFNKSIGQRRALLQTRSMLLCNNECSINQMCFVPAVAMDDLVLALKLRNANFWALCEVFGWWI